MKEIQIFVIHNEEELLNKVNSGKFIKKINLNNLELDEKYKNNKLAENRFLIHLSNNTSLLSDYEYVGICSASWDSKYKTNEEDNNIAIATATVEEEIDDQVFVIYIIFIIIYNYI
jgi:hypothetical protein